MIKGNEDVWVRFFFGKKGKDGIIPTEAIDEYIRCYSIENTPATGASYYRSMRLDAHTLGDTRREEVSPCRHSIFTETRIR